MIGIFDSGLGGISVWQALYDALPFESLIYLGDGLRCPYGSRSEAEVKAFTEEAVERLLAEGCKMIVIACNTATAVAIKYLREKYPNVPFVGLEPAVKPAALTTKTGIIGVLATERSLQGDHFRRAEAKYGEEVRILKAVGEGFVEAVEANEEQSPETADLVRKAVAPLVEAGADKIVLGCTHYPFLRDVIASVAGDGVEIIDSSEAVARRVANLLDENGIRAEQSKAEYKFLTFADEAYAAKLRDKAFKK
jgi:glutamate racemase